MEFLNSDKSEPMEEVSDHLLTQIVYFLFLLASSKRDGENSKLSRVYKHAVNLTLELVWVNVFFLNIIRRTF